MMTNGVRSPAQDAEAVYTLIFDSGMHSKRGSKIIEINYTIFINYTVLGPLKWLWSNELK